MANKKKPSTSNAIDASTTSAPPSDLVRLVETQYARGNFAGVRALLPKLRVDQAAASQQTAARMFALVRMDFVPVAIGVAALTILAIVAALTTG